MRSLNISEALASDLFKWIQLKMTPLITSSCLYFNVCEIRPIRVLKIFTRTMEDLHSEATKYSSQGLCIHPTDDWTQKVLGCLRDGTRPHTTDGSYHSGKPVGHSMILHCPVQTRPKACWCLATFCIIRHQDCVCVTWVVLCRDVASKHLEGAAPPAVLLKSSPPVTKCNPWSLWMTKSPTADGPWGGQWIYWKYADMGATND